MRSDSLALYVRRKEEENETKRGGGLPANDEYVKGR
jgi:hypothetical protein